MLGSLGQRLLLFIPTLLGVLVLTFSLVKLAPGDPTLLFGAEEAPGQDLAAARSRMRERFLLDEPVAIQFLHWLGPFDLSPRGHSWFGGSGERSYGGVLTLDFGREFLRPSVSVAGEIAARLWVTGPIGLIALLISYGIAVPLGVALASRRGSRFDALASLLLFALYALPAFWAALLLQFAFGPTGLDWLPTVGLHGRDSSELGALGRALDTAAHACLPILCLSLASVPFVARQTRAAVSAALAEEYVRGARARGLSERTVLWKHAFRNALVPLVTHAAQVLPALVGGAVLVEVVFDLPGMGRYAYEGLIQRDLNVILATTLVGALLTMVGMLVSDLLVAVVDPRVRHAER